jgi:hypothetical protein
LLYPINIHIIPIDAAMTAPEYKLREEDEVDFGVAAFVGFAVGGLLGWGAVKDMVGEKEGLLDGSSVMSLGEMGGGVP